MLGSTSICFDLSVFEIFGPLSWGGGVILAENVLELGGMEEEGGGEVDQHGAVRDGGVGAEKECWAGVEVVNLAGEALKRELVEEMYGKTKVRRVVNLYGPTEDTTYTTYAEMRRGRRGSGDWEASGEHEVYLVDGGWKAGGSGDGGRDLSGRRGTGARVFEASRADGGKVRGEAVQRRGRSEVVSDGRCGPV